MTSRFVRLFLTIVCLLSLPVSAASVGAGVDTDSLSLHPTDSPSVSASVQTASTSAMALEGTRSSEHAIRQTTVLRHLPDVPGEFEVETTFDVPESVTGLEVRLESRADRVSLEGFDRVDTTTYEWTESTDRPRLTYRMPADRTHLEHRHRRPSSDGYAFVDAGSWAVVAVPTVQLRWLESEPVIVDRDVSIDGPGATGGDIAFFGAIEETVERESAVDERIRLVVPEVASLSESPTDILESLVRTSETLRVGAPNDEVFVVAVPAADADWGAGGIQYGDGDAWVVDDAPLGVPNNVWVHEYVHTRQDFSTDSIGTTAETNWLTEAQADYYAALSSLEQGQIAFHEFRDFLADGGKWPYADEVLTDPSTWARADTNYVKGRLVFGAIDRHLRLETDGERTAVDVVRALNLHEKPVTQEAFLTVLEDLGGADVRAFAERYTQTAVAPDTWAASEHRAAFDRATAIVGYSLAADPITITGPVRDGTLEDVQPVGPGETVSIPVAVENVGDRSGPYDATLQVDGRLVDTQRGTLAAGERTLETVSWTPESAGRYDVRVGDRRLTVDVVAFTSGEITALTADPARVSPDEPATLTATVENPADRPAEVSVPFRTHRGVTDERTITLAAGETTTVETTVTFDDPGRYEVAVGDHARTVTVERTGFVGDVDEAAESVPGFGPGAAVVALAFAFAIVSRTSGRERTDE